jgi:hypothetical protein
MARVGWARCLDSVADVLRRGAWYEVVDETAEGDLIVSVRSQRVRISRAEVHVRSEPPDAWSIVVRTGLLRPTLETGRTSVHSTYAVCPACHERQEFKGKPKILTCTRCGLTAPVDWSQTC